MQNNKLSPETKRIHFTPLKDNIREMFIHSGEVCVRTRTTRCVRGPTVCIIYVCARLWHILRSIYLEQICLFPRAFNRNHTKFSNVVVVPMRNRYAYECCAFKNLLRSICHTWKQDLCSE